ncbi:hypothetical protein [Haladaptatus sp. CMAA 1911]|uniref:hypothetical protein n=1 Tax=unclassified Haladaptatus TaxID=2622732 RepID=UPI0037549535
MASRLRGGRKTLPKAEKRDSERPAGDDRLKRKNWTVGRERTDEKRSNGRKEAIDTKNQTQWRRTERQVENGGR